jgi:hypothetical protein
MGKLTAAQQAGSYYARKRNRATTLVTDIVSRAQGSVSFSTNVAQTVTIGGTVVTFGTSFALGATVTATLANLLTYLTASADTNLVKASYQVLGSALIVTCRAPGAGHLTLAASAGAVSNGRFTLPQIRKRAAL